MFPSSGFITLPRHVGIVQSIPSQIYRESVMNRSELWRKAPLGLFEQVAPGFIPSTGATNPVYRKRRGARVLGSFIDALECDQAMDQLVAWARCKESRYVAVCNVHVVVTASRDAAYGRIIDGADMATPDGAPVAWMLRRFGFRDQPRITGPDLMLALYDRCSKEQLPVYFYGSTDATLATLCDRLVSTFPSLAVAGTEAPPFRPLSDQEDEEVVKRINDSGAAVVFVGLGCPKQERWMAAHRGRIHAVMIGVGAAFDFHAGTLRRAPTWMQKSGLEWLFRLASEPRRLWKRYLVTNTFFILGAMRQLFVS
jgi:N-acetylglucosaminyldiphosphoundecaprenol N-acetyl-beta-D-mannosaminyltransferase